MTNMKSKDITPALCIATGFLSLLSYIVTFSVAWGFFDQGYPNGLQVRNAALVSTVPLIFIMTLCFTCTLTLCCKDVWLDCCPGYDYQSSRAVFWLTVLSPLFMVLAGIFSAAGGIQFAVIAATFVSQRLLIT